MSTAILFLAMCGWLRRRYLTAQHMFASIDRPEDAPHTLSWLVSPTVLCAIFLLALTLTEAKSANTWDTPFLFIVDNGIVTGVYLL